MASRKICYLHIFAGREDDINQSSCNIRNLFQYIMNKELIQRKYDIPNSERFMFLQTYSLNNNFGDIILISAQRGYSAPLINANNLVSRDNPKQLYEGEQVKTHVVLRFSEEGCIMLLELGKDQLSATRIKEYLNNFIPEYNRSCDEHPENEIAGMVNTYLIPSDTFEDMLQDTERVLSIETTINKQILGDDFLNFSNRSENLRDTVTLKISVKRNHDGRDVLNDIFNKFTGHTTQITRIKAKIVLPNNVDGIIDTETIIRKEIVDVNKDPSTGEVVSQNILQQMHNLAEAL